MQLHGSGSQGRWLPDEEDGRSEARPRQAPHRVKAPAFNGNRNTADGVIDQDAV